jgi:hypothetical protein
MLRLPNHSRAGAALLAALALATPLAGCPGDLSDPGRFASQFGTGGGGAGGDDGGMCPDTPTFLAATCTAAGCHAAASPAASLDLASPDVYTRLSGKMATGGAGLLIDPQSPAASILYLKLLAPPPYGSRMPLVGSPLSDAETACVLSWITTPN